MLRQRTNAIINILKIENKNNFEVATHEQIKANGITDIVTQK